MKKLGYGIFAFILFLSIKGIYHLCCSSKPIDSIVEIDTTRIRTGDLIFRQGISPASELVRHLDTQQFSHVGLLIKYHGLWHVLHAVPGESDDNRDTVKLEPLNLFLSKDRCEKAKVVAIPCSETVSRHAAQYALTKRGLHFDDAYSLSDSSKYYCTELVWQSYLHEGLDISRGRRHKLRFLGSEKSVLLPSDLI